MLTIYNSKKDFESVECTTAILPVGAVEQHGSHLPVGTDTIFAQLFAEKIAEKLDAYLLPAIPITSSIEHRKGKGTVYVKGETLALIVRDIAESLYDAGYRRLIIVNFHGGNWILKPTIRRLNRELHPMRVMLLHADVAASRHGEIFQHVENDIHAGEFETSLMLAFYPEYVQEIKKQTDPVFLPQAFMDYYDVTDMTQDGYWGFPEAATAEKGLKVMELMVECAIRYIDSIEQALQKVNRQSDIDKG